MTERDPSNPEGNPPEPSDYYYVRKDVLVGLGLAALGAAGVGIYLAGRDRPPQQPRTVEVPEPLQPLPRNLQPEQVRTSEMPPFTMQLYRERDLIPLDQFGLGWVPDTHTSIVPNGQDIDVFVVAGKSTYLLRGPDLQHLKPHQGENRRAKPVLGPEPRDSFGRDYRGFGAVLADPKDPQKRIGIFHGEDHPPSGKGYYASVGVTLSRDKGATWGKASKVIGGWYESKPKDVPPRNNEVTGAGQPSAVIKGDDIYLYYADWSRSAEIHLAKVPFAKADDPNAWEKHTKNGFVKADIYGSSNAVVETPTPQRETRYAALPSVSIDKATGSFLMVFESDNAFYLTSSQNGITWAKQPIQILKFPESTQVARQEGRLWYSYPTLFSPQEKTDQTTSQTGYLIASKSERGEAHHMVGFPFEIKKA